MSLLTKLRQAQLDILQSTSPSQELVRLGVAKDIADYLPKGKGITAARASLRLREQPKTEPRKRPNKTA